MTPDPVLTEEQGKQLDALFTPLNEKLCSACRTKCCRDCGYTRGYFEYSHDNITEMNERMSEFKFTERRGFLGKAGCKLPRHLRSYICLAFTCFAMERKLGTEMHELKRSILDIIRDTNEAR